MSVRILTGSCLDVLPTLEAESVQLCLTSPPYAFLRSYLPAGHPDKHKEMGGEPTPDQYVAALVAVMREVKRCLRKDGCLVLNLGDSYSGSGRGGHSSTGIVGDHTRRQGFDGNRAADDLPPKNLLMIPFRVALALQQDGWILRSVMPWVKRSAMPESVTDRPASAIEYLFLFARSDRYFWDAEAIRMRLAAPPHAPGNRVALGEVKRNDFGTERMGAVWGTDAGRSYRNSDPFFATWQGLMLDEAGDPLALVVNPKPYKGAHFAVFPPGLVEPFVKAATSERGACPTCGAPWRRVTEKRAIDYGMGAADTNGHKAVAVNADARVRFRTPTGHTLSKTASETTGWAPSCPCPPADPAPCVVLDPFGGAGTAALVADRLGRDAVGIELNPTYAAMARDRITGDAPMFASVESA